MLLVGMPVCSKRQWVISRILTLCCRTRRQQQFVRRWDGEVAFSVWLSCTFTSMTMRLSVMHKYQGLIFFILLLSPTHLKFFCYFRRTSQFSHSRSSSQWKFVGSYDNKLLFIVCRWYKELFVVKIYKILKRQNVLVIILQYIGKNKLIIVSNYLSFQNLLCENTFKECLFYFIFKI